MARKRQIKEFVSYMYQNPQLGIELRFSTVAGGYTSMHYHDTIEIIYPLNGDASIRLEDKRYDLPRKQVTVIGAGMLHSTHLHGSYGMGLAVRISKKALVSIQPDIENYQIHCVPDEIRDDQFAHYLEICRIMERVTTLYISDAPAFEMEVCGLLLQAMARLIRYFSSSKTGVSTNLAAIINEPVRESIRYVEKNYAESIALDDVCALTGYGKESFCRLFKKKTGISFLKYVNEVRLTHCCHELLTTDDPVALIMERNGIRGQKQFNASFKELYGATPSQIRKQAAIAG